jgi:hypothetical protein
LNANTFAICRQISINASDITFHEILASLDLSVEMWKGMWTEDMQASRWWRWWGELIVIHLHIFFADVSKIHLEVADSPNTKTTYPTAVIDKASCTIANSSSTSYVSFTTSVKLGSLRQAEICQQECHWTPLCPQKLALNFADKWLSLSRYIWLAD